MQAKLVTYEHSGNGMSLFIIPETECERALLQALWKHGEMKTCNGVADRSAQGFCIAWKLREECVKE